jgi:PAS domain S-box-containing protein
MLHSIRQRFALVVAIILALAVVSYLEVAYFVGRLSQSVHRAEMAEEVGIRVQVLERMLWEARFWEKEVMRNPDHQVEERFGRLMTILRAHAEAVDASVLAPVLSDPAARMGNLLTLLQSYELSFDYLHRLRNRQQVFQANLLFNFWDMADHIQREGSAELLRQALEMDQTRKAYLELHQEHQFRTLQKELAQLEESWARLRPLSPEIRVRLGNLRTNLEGERGLDMEIKLVSHRFDEITAQLTDTVRAIVETAHSLVKMQNHAAASLQDVLPKIFFASGVFGVLILLGLLAYVARAVIVPVGALSRVAREVEAGRQETRAEAKGKDEIADLGRAINAMLDTLAENDQRLIAYQSGLENIVEERTRKLAASEARLRGLVESARDGLLRIDARGRLELLNPVCVRMLDGGLREGGGRRLAEVVHPQDWPGLEAFLAGLGHAAAAPGGPPPVEFRLKGADGSWQEVEATFSPLPDAEEGREFMAVLRDASGRKQAEKVLRESEERYRWLIEKAGVGHFVAGAETMRLVFLNQAACDMIHISQEQALTLTLADLVAPSERGEVRQKLSRRLAGEKLDPLVRYRVQRLDGSSFLAEVMVNLVDYRGRPALQGVLRDVTEEIRRERERTRQGKLEAIGTLAGGIAHDFNNFLAGILGNLNLARLLGERGEDWQRALAAAETTTQRAAQMTSQLLTFAKGGQPALEVVDVERLAAEAVDIALGKDPQVTCVSELAPDLMAVRADRAQIMQVLTNLLINARQAMPGGGVITVAAQNVKVGEEEAVGLLDPGRYVRLSVADQGPGIPPEDLERIFDPFYTTKSGGTGLGLAITHSVVNRHGGHIEVASAPGQGAVFTLYLPATRERPAQAEVMSGQLTAGGGRVLVVDDEQAIRELTSEVLELAGYQAQAYPNFREGLDALRQALGQGRPFDLAIFDLSVPGDINGAEAIKLAREIDPGLKAVVASGYSDLDLLANPAKYGFDAAVRKPVSVSLLTQVVAEVLCRVPPAEPERVG